MRSLMNSLFILYNGYVMVHGHIWFLGHDFELSPFLEEQLLPSNHWPDVFIVHHTKFKTNFTPPVL